MIPPIPVIAIIGGLQSGRTSSRKPMLELLAQNNFDARFSPDVPTLMMESNLVSGPRTFADEHDLECATKMMHFMQQLALEHLEKKRGRSDKRPVLLTHHGFPCLEKYMPPGMYPRLLKQCKVGTPVEARDLYYTAAFHLTTAALGAKEHYTASDPIEQAISRDAATRSSWLGQPHLRIIDNSTDFPGKIERLGRHILRALGEPTPKEIERKFLCAPIDFSNFPVPCAPVDIEQIYLYSRDGSTKRVRKRGQHGSYVYFKTEKRSIGEGINAEKEKVISSDKYEWSRDFMLEGTRPIHKVRCCFVYENQYFELDRIEREKGQLFILEIELDYEGQVPKLPPFLDIREEVTHDKRYGNKTLARIAS